MKIAHLIVMDSIKKNRIQGKSNRN